MSAALKLNGSHNGACASVSAEPAAEPSRFYSAGEVKILVIDDDPTIGRLVQAAFAAHDFCIDLVADPEQVEAALRQGPYHVVVLDYVLPGLDSAQVVDMVRELQPDASV